MSPLDTIELPGAVGVSTLEDIRKKQKAQWTGLEQSLAAIHKEIAAVNTKKRAAARKSQADKSGVKMAQFAIGDYVLYTEVWGHTRSKLKVRWCGPAEVVDTVSNWIFVVRNLVTGDGRGAHASRLKFYTDSLLAVTEELLLHVTHNSEGHVVDRLLDRAYNKSKKEHQLLVRWRGLDPAEDSWEPATVIYQDVPAVVTKFVAERKDDAVVQALAKALRLPKSS